MAIEEGEGNHGSIPTPEQVGFQQIRSDFLPKSAFPEGTQYRRIANVSVDATADRRARWEWGLESIALVEGDIEMSKNAVTTLTEYADQERKREGSDPQLVEVVEFVRSVIANFQEPAALNLVLQRGARGVMQESIARFSGAVHSHFASNDDLANVVYSSCELARELYAQEHEGTPYQTQEKIAEIEAMKNRAANITIK